MVACGGGGDTAQTNTSNTPSPAPSTSIIPIDKNQALTISAQDGSISTPLQFSPLSKDRSVLFTANRNNAWRLQSALATIKDSPFVNPAASLLIELDENDPSKIARFEYSQGVTEQDSWGITCTQGCADNYRYKIEQQGDKHYFILDAAAKQQAVTIGAGKQPLTNQASVSGQIRLEVDPSWPVWKSDRFPVHQYQSNVAINDQVTPVRSLITSEYEGRRVFIVDFTDTKKSKLTYGFGNDELLTYTYTNETGSEIPGFYGASDGKPPLTEEIDRIKGERTVFFNNSGFVSDPRYKPQPNITITGQISEKILAGSVDADGEVFTPDEFSPYAENESTYYWFSHNNVQLNVRYNTTTKNFDLAYQKPLAGALNINIHQQFNCRQVMGNCQGIRFSEDKTTLYLEGVLLQDGRTLNGVIRNIGINP